MISVHTPTPNERAAEKLAQGPAWLKIKALELNLPPVPRPVVRRQRLALLRRAERDGFTVRIHGDLDEWLRAEDVKA